MTTAIRHSRFHRRLSILGAAFFGLLLGAWPAEAQPRRVGEGTVVACSHYGNGCVRGPVRSGPVGLEVRMPGGTWIGCKRDCRRTLREEALDFFETLNERVWDR